MNSITDAFANPQRYKWEGDYERSTKEIMQREMTSDFILQPYFFDLRVSTLPLLFGHYIIERRDPPEDFDPGGKEKAA